MEEESAFSFVTQRNRNKHKKKKVSSDVSDADIKDLVSKKKKELAHDSSNGFAQKKKRKQDALEDKQNELWQTFEILNPSKKMKKNKVTKSIFSNCNISEGTPNLFFNIESDKNSKNNDSSKDSKKRKKQFLACSTPKPVENDKSQESSKKKKSKKKQTPSINGSDGVNAVKSKPFEVKTVKIPKSVRADSVQVGETVFGWMISPFDVQEFFTHVWEKKPLHVVRNDETFFDGICSVQDFDGALRRNDVYFNKNIDVTSYVNGERSTENVSGKARPAIVWSFYDKGRSIRMLNPQTFIPNVATLITSLQEFFRCFVGANIYLTPPGTQGFAPHYDDIEAFVLQLEGEKKWSLYNPRNPEERLPRVSSPNFDPDEIGEPILETTLKPGDLLYFPRGFIHQARCVPGKHSLHITVSCYQKNSWADLLEKVMPVALGRAIEEDVEFRKGLPLDFLDNVGLVHSDSESEIRQQILAKFSSLWSTLLQYCPIDAAADQIGREFMHSALPPCLTKNESAYCLSREDPVFKSNMLESLKASSKKPLAVKLVRNYALRLVCEEDGLKVYYNTDNEKEYQSLEEIFFEISEGWARGVDHLIHSYPKFIPVKDLSLGEQEGPEEVGWEERADFVYFLWEKGLLLFDVPVSEI